MKVVHINTLDYGGAAIAAVRIHNAMLESGIDSSFLSLKKTIPNIINHVILPDYLNKTATNQTVSLKNYLKIKFNKDYKNYLKELNKKRVLKNLANKTNREVISFPQTEFDLLHLVSEIQQADIIHLHWVADFVDYPSFFRNLSKPIVWTLHDENPFRGIFHYAGDEETNSEAALKTADTQAYKLKKEALQSAFKLHIITPSSWLANLSSNQEVFRKSQVTAVANGLDTTIFKIFNKEFARKVFNLPTDKKIALFVADSLSNRRKGFDLLIGALQKLEGKKDILLVAIGNVPAYERQENVRYIGSISDERVMALAYSAVDVFILPSREDNLPNTMIESLSCGTPIIGFPIGGIKETIQNEFNGYLCPELSIEALKDTIEIFFKNSSSFNSEKISADAHAKFDNKKQAAKYTEIYNNLLIN
jgi:glycosyltransferase involved in cell wall biosynthesis